jgi:hypothetical protein
MSCGSVVSSGKAREFMGRWLYADGRIADFLREQDSSLEQVS